MGSGEAINIGGGHDYSVREVADLIGGPTIFVEPRIEPKKTLADTTRAKELLGWEPQVLFEQGIAELKKVYALA